MKSNYSIIKVLLQTEKAALFLPQNKYVFIVDRNATKPDIKKAVEAIYKVTVTNVNTLMTRGKNKKVRFQEGKTPDRKKAVVRLKQGDKIDIA